MPTRREISKLKADFISLKQAEIGHKISLEEERLYDKLIDLYLKNNPEKNSAAILKNINAFERELKKLLAEQSSIIMAEYVASGKQISSLSLQYFTSMISDEGRLMKIKQQTDKVINGRFGIKEDGSLKVGGFIDKITKDKTVQNQILKEVRKAIVNNADLETVKETFRKIIVGKKDESGILSKYFNTIARDLLNRIDNGNSKIYAEELGLRYAYYSGGLIKTSRSFCIKNNGKIFNTDQIEAMREDPFIVEMFGGDIAEYDPYEQPGGYGCLHSWDWITDDLAKGIIGIQNKKAKERNDKFKDRYDL